MTRIANELRARPTIGVQGSELPELTRTICRHGREDLEERVEISVEFLMVTTKLLVSCDESIALKCIHDALHRTAQDGRSTKRSCIRSHHREGEGIMHTHFSMRKVLRRIAQPREPLKNKGNINIAKLRSHFTQRITA